VIVVINFLKVDQSVNFDNRENDLSYSIYVVVIFLDYRDVSVSL